MTDKPPAHVSAHVVDAAAKEHGLRRAALWEAMREVIDDFPDGGNVDHVVGPIAKAIRLHNLALLREFEQLGMISE